MNPAMLSMLLPTVQKVFGSCKLDGLLGDNADLFKGLMSQDDVSPEAQVMGAIALLASHAPTDPARALAYSEAISQISGGLAKLRAAMGA